MKKSFFIQTLLASLAVATPVELAPRAATTAAVADLSVKRGAPQNLASGCIYGEPDTPNQIPDQFYTETNMKYFRAGGAQLNAPNRGWIWGEYNGRFQSTLNNYRTARKYGANFILLPHDIWGTDRTNSSTVWPGDNNNWTDYNRFLDRLIADIKANGMTAGLVWDIWNEPDLTIFWKRPVSQWLNMYGITHRRIRSDSAFNNVLITGPSLAGQPTTGNSWWTNYLSYISSNNLPPDQWAWHLEGNSNDINDDLQTNNATLTSMLRSYNLPNPRSVNINEYGNSGEQVPSGTAWWISRLERYDALGLRGNWRSGFELHDYLCNILGKPNAGTSSYNPTGTGYYPVGEYQVYKYYHTSMTGTRVATATTTDRLFDIYVVIGNDRTVRILSGARVRTGTWAITVNKLSSLGLSTSGSISINTYAFKHNGLYGRVDAPTFLNTVSHTYSGDSLSFPIYQTDTTTAYAFEFKF